MTDAPRRVTPPELVVAPTMEEVMDKNMSVAMLATLQPTSKLPENPAAAVHVGDNLLQTLEVPTDELDLVKQNVFLAHQVGQLYVEAEQMEEAQKELETKLWNRLKAKDAALSTARDKATVQRSGQHATGDARIARILKREAGQPSLPTLPMEIEGPLNAFCAHEKVELLERDLVDTVLEGRYTIKRILRAVPCYRVVALAQEVYTGQRVWIKFVWKMPGRRTHDVLLREFYTLYCVCRGRAAESVLPVISFSATTGGKLAHGIMEALKGRTLEQEFRETQQSTQGGGMTAFRAAELSDEILRSLGKVHSADLIVGDVRPQTIWLEFEDDKPQDHSEGAQGPEESIGLTRLRFLDWSHSLLKKPERTSLGPKFTTELHHFDANFAKSLQVANAYGQPGWIEQCILDLKRRMMYWSPEQFEQLIVSAQKPRKSKPADNEQTEDEKCPMPMISVETDIFEAGMTILRCFRQGQYPEMSPELAALHDAIREWIKQGLPSEGTSVWNLGCYGPCAKAQMGGNPHLWPEESFALVDVLFDPHEDEQTEAVVAKALQSHRESRWHSAGQFRRALLARTRIDRLTKQFLTSHKEAAGKGKAHWNISNEPLQMPHIWRILDVLERHDRPSFTHVVIGAFDDDVPHDVIRHLASLFRENYDFLDGELDYDTMEPFSPVSYASTPAHSRSPSKATFSRNASKATAGFSRSGTKQSVVSNRYASKESLPPLAPLVAIFEGFELPREALKIGWPVVAAARMSHFLLLTVEHLDLSHSRVETDITDLADALSHHDCTLMTLDLSGSYVRDYNTTLLASVLPTNTLLHSLNLANNNLTDVAAVALVDGLMGNRSLTALNLAENNLGIKSAIAFASLFGAMDAPDEDAEGISPDHGMRTPRSPRQLADRACLTTLELSHNSFVGGCLYWGRALRSQGSAGLAYLGLNANGLMENDAKCLAEGLIHNHGLRALGLADNQLGHKGMHCLLEGLNDKWHRQQGATPLDLDISRNGVGEIEQREWLRGFHWPTPSLLGLDVEIRRVEYCRASQGEECAEGPVHWPWPDRAWQEPAVVLWTD